jgi:hypothetical protein
VWKSGTHSRSTPVCASASCSASLRSPVCNLETELPPQLRPFHSPHIPRRSAGRRPALITACSPRRDCHIIDACQEGAHRNSQRGPELPFGWLRVYGGSLTHKLARTRTAGSTICPVSGQLDYSEQMFIAKTHAGVRTPASTLTRLPRPSPP